MLERISLCNAILCNKRISKDICKVLTNCFVVYWQQSFKLRYSFFCLNITLNFLCEKNWNSMKRSRNWLQPTNRSLGNRNQLLFWWIYYHFMKNTASFHWKNLFPVPVNFCKSWLDWKLNGNWYPILILSVSSNSKTRNWVLPPMSF